MNVPHLTLSAVVYSRGTVVFHTGKQAARLLEMRLGVCCGLWKTQHSFQRRLNILLLESSEEMKALCTPVIRKC